MRTTAQNVTLNGAATTISTGNAGYSVGAPATRVNFGTTGTTSTYNNELTVSQPGYTVTNFGAPSTYTTTTTPYGYNTGGTILINQVTTQ